MEKKRNLLEILLSQPHTQNRNSLAVSMKRAIKCDLGPQGDRTLSDRGGSTFSVLVFSVPCEISLIAAKSIPLLATLHRITAGSSVPSLPLLAPVSFTSPTFYGKHTDLQHHGARSIWEHLF